MRVLVGLMIAVAVALSPALAQDKRTVRVTQAVASMTFLPADYAQAAGYFAEEGLEVQQIATRGGGPDMAALLSGDVEFNFGVSTYMIGAAEAERPLVNVLNMLQRNLIGVVISTEAAEASGVSPDAPLEERAAALKGLKLGFTRPGALTHRQFTHLLNMAGLTEDDAELIAIGGPPALISALETGQIDGYAISTPHDRATVQRGKAVMWVDNANGDDPSIDPFFMSGLVTSPDLIEKEPELVEKMVRALRRAMDDIRNQPVEKTAEVIKEIYPQIDPEVLRLGLEATRNTINPTGEVTREMWEGALKLDGRDVSVDALMALYDDRFLK
jgi:NitT/TauT family transport system substrate-binding protein